MHRAAPPPISTHAHTHKHATRSNGLLALQARDRRLLEERGKATPPHPTARLPERMSSPEHLYSAATVEIAHLAAAIPADPFPPTRAAAVSPQRTSDAWAPRGHAHRVAKCQNGRPELQRALTDDGERALPAAQTPIAARSSWDAFVGWLWPAGARSEQSDALRPNGSGPLSDEPTGTCPYRGHGRSKHHMLHSIHMDYFERRGMRDPGIHTEGIPHGTLSLTARYPARHGIPHCVHNCTVLSRATPCLRG